MSIIKIHDVTLYGSTNDFDIILNPLTDEHLPLLYKWGADPEVVYWSDTGNVEVFEEDEVREIISSVSANSLCFIVDFNDILRAKKEFHYRLTRDDYIKIGVLKFHLIKYLNYLLPIFNPVSFI